MNLNQTFILAPDTVMLMLYNCAYMLIQLASLVPGTEKECLVTLMRFRLIKNGVVLVCDIYTV